MHGAALNDANVCVCVEPHPAELPVFARDMRLQSFYHIIMCQCDDCALQSTGPAVIRGDLKGFTLSLWPKGTRRV